MLRHIEGLECPLCNEKLRSADPTIVNIYKLLIKPNFPDCHISWTYRNKEDQEEAFKNKRSKLHYPDSLHNKTDSYGKPCARAIDLFQLTKEKKAAFPVKYYFQIAELLKKQQMPIRWGGTFKSISDFDHFELAVN